MIDTHWSSEAVDASDKSGTTQPSASCTALQSDDTISRQANPSSDHSAALGRPEYTVAPAPAPPMTPPPVRVPHLHVNDNMQGESSTLVNNSNELQPLLHSPSVAQRLKTSVEPPKTPSGGPAFEAFNDDEENKLSASQRVRMGLSVLMTQANGNGPLGADMTRRKSHEEESQRSQHGVAAPMSCPRLLQASSKQQQSPALKDTQPRQRYHSHPHGSNLIASKLLPSRMCLNTLIEYVRELNQSAASLRVELEHTKQKADKELFEAHVQVNELQESVRRAEFEQDQARARAEEQEQLVRDLQAQVTTLQQQVQAAASSFCQMEAFVSNSLQYETLQASASAADAEVASHFKLNDNEAISGVRPASTDQTEADSQQQQDPPTSRDARNQQLILSPRVVKPLWEPWSSGSESPLTSAVNLPMFTVAPSEADLLPSSPVIMPQPSVSVANTSSRSHEHELKSIVSPKNLLRVQERVLKPPPFPTTPAVPENLAHTVPYTAAPPVFSLAAVSVPELKELQIQRAVVGSSENGNLAPHAAEMETATHQTPAEASSLPASLTLPPTGFHPQSHEGDAGKHDSTLLTTSSVLPKLFALTQAQHSETVRDFARVLTLSEVVFGAMSNISRRVCSCIVPQLLVPTATTESTAASLEKLLTNFFSQFDKSKVRMAEVYGKRYFGHEDKLFGELTRRYGKEKVAVLQHRYKESLLATQVVDTSFLHGAHPAESLHSHDAPTAADEATRSAPECVAVQDPHKPAGECTKATHQDQVMQGTCAGASEVMRGEAPTQKVSPRGRFRPSDHGFHVPSRTELPSLLEEESEVSEADTSSSYALNGTSQFLPVAATGDGIQYAAPSASQNSEQSPPASPHRVAPQRRPMPFFPSMGGIVDLKTDAPPLPTRELSFANGGGTKSSPIRRQGEPSTGHPPLFSSSLGEMSDEKKTPAALFRSSSPESVEVNKTVLAKPSVAVAEPHVTMECLLKELYKKHQPDKLRNVAQIAKEYTGKERVLVRLLKAKYGALSVKRLEENLHVLENSVDRQKTVADAKLKASKRKASVTRFLTRCTLLSVTSLSLGGTSLALLNSRECHSIQSSSSQSNTGTNSASCYKLNLGLEEFDLMRIPEYVGQSYPVECFCTNWVEREDAFLSSHSGGDLANLAEMLPFSRGAIDAYVVDTPVREYYTKYAQPVIEISKEYAPVIQSALAEVYGGVSARLTELQEQLFPFAAPPNESENDFTRETESAASALTKVARASKSLLNSLQEKEEEEAQDVDNQGVKEGIDAAIDAEHKSDVVLEKSNGPVVSGLVEVAVLQERVDISYTKSSDLLDVTVDSVNSHPASNQDIDSSDITTHADHAARGDNSDLSGEAGSSENVFNRVAGATGQAAAGAVAEEVAVDGSEESTTKVGTVVDGKILQPPTSLELSESSDLVALTPAILKVEESVTAERTGVEEDFEGTNHNLPAESEPMNKLETSSSKQMVTVLTKESTPDSQTAEKPREVGASSLVDTAADDIEVIQTESITEEVTSASQLVGEALEFSNLDDNQQTHDTISLQRADEVIIVNQAVATESTERKEVPDAKEADESTAVTQADGRESDAPTVVKKDRTVEVELAESTEHKQIETGECSVALEEHNPTEAEKERPRAATEERTSVALVGHQEESESSDLVYDDEDEDDDLDFGAELFNVDPWELLEMAERAAAAQLSTQNR